MRKEFDVLLCTTFPNLYKNRFASMQVTCMCWGFPGDGWFLLIWNLSEKLEKMILALPERAEDSYGNCRTDCCASQVKEKFGTLRFYMDASNQEMEDLIDKAEELSRITCEECGAPGRLRGKHWLYTACDEHTKEEDKNALPEPEWDDNE